MDGQKDGRADSHTDEPANKCTDWCMEKEVQVHKVGWREGEGRGSLGEFVNLKEEAAETSGFDSQLMDPHYFLILLFNFLFISCFISMFEKKRGPMDGRTGGWMNIPSYRDARMHLKIKN